jgi:hypothetical protein
VPIGELLEFLGERAHAMMFFLVRDVPSHLSTFDSETENAP